RRPAPKSTGKELFHPGYLDRFLAGRSPSLEDLMATLTALTARTVAAAVGETEEVVLSGGGTRNPALGAALRGELPGPPVRTELAAPLPSPPARSSSTPVTWTASSQAAVLPSRT